MQKQENLRSYQKIAASIKQSFIKNKLSIGDKLPPERELADHFSVSRTLVREALIMLEIEGLVEIKKGSGVYIRAVQQVISDEEEESLYAEIGPFELLQARQLIECGIAEFAALQAKPNDIAQLKSILAREKQYISSKCKNKNDYDEDEQFHLTIANITQNNVLIQLQKELWKYRSKKMWSRLHSHITDTKYRCLWLSDHEKIMLALQKKDPLLAKQAVWQHLENVKQKLFELSDINDNEFDGFLYQQSPLKLTSKDNK